MEFVLDASIVVPWFAMAQQTPYSLLVLDRMPDSTVHVPSIWPMEIASVLLRELNLGVLAVEDVDLFLSLLESYDIRVVDRLTNARSLFSAAMDHHLKPADASYLDLASHLRLPLATADSQMRQAAQQAGNSTACLDNARCRRFVRNTLLTARMLESSTASKELHAYPRLPRRSGPVRSRVRRPVPAAVAVSGLHRAL